MKKAITVSRKWHHPKIEVSVTNEEIGLKMDIEDFKRILVNEIAIDLVKFKKAMLRDIGSVAMTFKRDTFEKKFTDALDNANDHLIHEIASQIDVITGQIVSGIKEESRKVMR